MSFPGLPVEDVEPASPASRAGLKAGDRLVSCNGVEVRDWVDFLLSSSVPFASLVVRRGLTQRKFRLRRRPGTGWGITLAGAAPRHCANRCVFCFVDQQPSGLRKNLVVKDDDVRYSFLYGTYITLTDFQVEEAIARGFSSLHVSVQTTDAALRGRMLGLPAPSPVLPQIDRLARHGVEIQAQIVEVPGWNDRYNLESTIDDLYGCPNVTVLGVVPVGLTKWRDGLEPLVRPSHEQASCTMDIIAQWQKKALRERGIRWVYPADEYYALTKRAIPDYATYAPADLTANGIGLLARMTDRCRGKRFLGAGTVVTGTLAAPYIGDLLSGSDYRILPVENTLMGPMVGVAGLLSGRDVIESVNRHSFSDGHLFLPAVMFNGDGVTLDEYTIADLTEETGLDTISLDSIGDLT